MDAPTRNEALEALDDLRQVDPGQLVDLTFRTRSEDQSDRDWLAGRAWERHECRCYFLGGYRGSYLFHPSDRDGKPLGGVLALTTGQLVAVEPMEGRAVPEEVRQNITQLRRRISWPCTPSQSERHAQTSKAPRPRRGRPN